MYFFSICNPLIKSPGLSGFREKEEKEKDTMKAANDKPISCKCVCVCVLCDRHKYCGRLAVEKRTQQTGQRERFLTVVPLGFEVSMPADRISGNIGCCCRS